MVGGAIGGELRTNLAVPGPGRFRPAAHVCQDDGRFGVGRRFGPGVVCMARPMILHGKPQFVGVRVIAEEQITGRLREQVEFRRGQFLDVRPLQVVPGSKVQFVGARRARTSTHRLLSARPANRSGTRSSIRIFRPEAYRRAETINAAAGRASTAVPGEAEACAYRRGSPASNRPSRRSAATRPSRSSNSGGRRARRLRERTQRPRCYGSPRPGGCSYCLGRAGSMRHTPRELPRGAANATSSPESARKASKSSCSPAEVFRGSAPV